MWNKKTVIHIHGGNVHPTYDDFITHLTTKEVDLERMRQGKDRWSKTLPMALGDTFDVLYLRMPNSDNAQYSEWKLWYERVIDAVHTPTVLVGHSLGAMFLVKYLSETETSRTVPLTLLIAPEYLAPHEKDVRTSFHLTTSPQQMMRKTEKAIFYHSKDDPVVGFESHAHFAREVPNAEHVTFVDRGHFLGESFPELVDAIMQTCK